MNRTPSTPRTLRIASTIALALALMIGSLAGATRAGATTGTTLGSLAGSVDAAGQAIVFGTIEVPEAGPVHAVLEWTVPNADLNLFVKDPNGVPVTSSTDPLAFPEVVTFNAATPGSYRFTVKARTGFSPFLLTLYADLSSRVQQLGRFAPVFMLGGSRNYGPAEAAEIARTSEVVVGIRGDFTGLVSTMKAANPNVKILVYMNGTFAQSTQGSAYPDSWYARNAGGGKVRSNNYGNYLMRHDVQGWRDDRLAFCRSLLAEDGFDGCMVDMLGTGALSEGYLNSVPINPNTGEALTPVEWIQSTGEIMASIRATMLGGTFMGNGVGNGRRWADTSVPQAILVDAADYQMAETWGRIPEAPINSFYPEDRWKEDVDLLAEADARGGAIAVTVKTWVASTQAQRDQWHRFTLASFLLGTGGKSIYSFLESSTSNPGATDPWARINLGTPLEAANKTAGGTWVRHFSHGIALVNPSNATTSYNLGGSYVAEDGTRVSGTLVLGPNSGRSVALR